MLSIILFTCSCGSNTTLYYSGKYRIRSLEGDTATFYKVKGKYTVPPAGLKKGLKIPLKRTSDKNKANVILINNN